MRLRVNEIDKWKTDLRFAYDCFKKKVVLENDGKFTYKYSDYAYEIRVYMLDKFNDYLFKRKDDTIDDNRAHGSCVTFYMPVVQDIIPVEVLERDKKLSKDACATIRDICEPIAKERDAYINLLYMSPSRDELEEIQAWCEKYRSFHDIQCKE